MTPQRPYADRDEVRPAHALNATSANGVLLTWAPNGDATGYVISRYGTPLGYAAAGDTGILLTNLTTGCGFEVDAFTADGLNDTVGTVSVLLGSGTPGVYTVSSPNLSSGELIPTPDQGTSSTLASTLTIANSTVAAGSEEEAILLSLGGTVQTDTATYTPLSGALQFFDSYTPAGYSAIGDQSGGLGCTHTDVLGLAESWHPGDDPSGYDFNSDYLVFSVTRVADFSASVQATSSVAARDSATPAIFTITRTGDTSAAGTVHFTMSDTAAADDFTLSDGTTVLTPDGGGTYSLIIGAGYSQGYITLNPGSTSTTNYDVTLTLTDSYAGATVSGGAATDSMPATATSTSDVGHIVTDPSDGGFSISQILDSRVVFTDSTTATTANPGGIVVDSSGDTTINIGRPSWTSGMAYQIYDLTASTMLSYGWLTAAGASVSLTGLTISDLVMVNTGATNFSGGGQFRFPSMIFQ